ncbi:type VII secretion-associated serine protease mycosin [Phytohabitans houttuyneae]|uniref:type VII secretion-associated serine protease mycosin n=1 Tax=Phytohabitans houttuyneae TaxID=1076126 RepID=UPI001567B0A0|nr:type VII secretion-associated serine protease mycosin [Phytohabitans houttuyneae]
MRSITLAILGLVTVISHAPHVDRIRNDQWHLRYLQAAEAHRHSRGDGVIVAVIDTGVDRHPDLTDNLLPGVDIDTTNDTGQHDVDSHGTGMAGLIAAHGLGPDTGALGIAPHAQVLPIRYQDLSNQGNSDRIARSIAWAVTHGADVINISGGGGPGEELRSAIDAAVRADVVVVASAGNRPAVRGVTFPAAYDGVLAVGAVDRQGNHAEVSVSGKQIAISAPGVDIYSTSYKGLYRKGTGTSDAAAIVSGAVALVRSKYPELSAPEVVHRLTATATDKGPPGRDEQYGYGVLNLVAALTADVPPLGSATTATATPMAPARTTAAKAAASPPG